MSESPEFEDTRESLATQDFALWKRLQALEKFLKVKYNKEKQEYELRM